VIGRRIRPLVNDALNGGLPRQGGDASFSHAVMRREAGVESNVIPFPIRPRADRAPGVRAVSPPLNYPLLTALLGNALIWALLLWLAIG
jgi:hypothetical protein